MPPPDVVLMDIRMPGMDGIEGVKLRRKHFPQTYIIMQTVFDDENLFNSLQAGAHRYLLKNTPVEKIIEGILEVVDGGAPMTHSTARKVLAYFSKNRRAARKNTIFLRAKQKYWNGW